MEEATIPRAHEHPVALCRLIVMDRRRAKLLVEKDQDGFHLPVAAMSSRERFTKTVNAVVKSRYNISAYCLFEVPRCNVSTNERGRSFEVVEAMSSPRDLPKNALWVSPSSLTAQAFEDDCDFNAVRAALYEIGEHESGTKPGPFAIFGWMQELLGWAQGQVAPRGFRLTGQFCQVHASPEFALVRLESEQSAFWFKAVGEPNRSELDITVKLAELFPGPVPFVAAVHAPWSGWLMAEAQGALLEDCTEPEAWKQAAEALARLQMSSLGFTKELLSTGSKDLSLRRLMESCNCFIDVAGELMKQQESTAVPALSEGELRALGDHIEETAAALSDLGIPDTLGNLDLNPGNLVLSSEGCVFLDWAAAYVGHPFMAFEYFRTHLARIRGNSCTWDSLLMHAYTAPWHFQFPSAVVSEAMRLSPLIAAYAYAIGTDVWRDPKARASQKTGGFLRSLVRRMQRESLHLRLRRTPCLD